MPLLAIEPNFSARRVNCHKNIDLLTYTFISCLNWLYFIRSADISYTFSWSLMRVVIHNLHKQPLVATNNPSTPPHIPICTLTSSLHLPPPYRFQVPEPMAVKLFTDGSPQSRTEFKSPPIHTSHGITHRFCSLIKAVIKF